jgi:hypothetical protein
MEGAVTMKDEIKLKAFSIESTVIETDSETFVAARMDGRLDHEYDAHLSDMSSETVIVAPDGDAYSPHTGESAKPLGSDALIDFVAPVLDDIPVAAIEDYLMSRWAGGQS